MRSQVLEATAKDITDEDNKAALPTAFGSYSQGRIILMGFGLDAGTTKGFIDGSIDNKNWISVAADKAIAQGDSYTVTDFVTQKQIKVATDITSKFEKSNLMYLSVTIDSEVTNYRMEVASASYEGGEADETTINLTEEIPVDIEDIDSAKVWPPKISSFTVADNDMDFLYYRFGVTAGDSTKGVVELSGILKDFSQ